MTILALLIPASLLLGCLGLGAFIWSLRNSQFEDLEGDQYRALFSETDPEASKPGPRPPE